MTLKPVSRGDRVLLTTPFLRKVGRRLLHTYVATTDSGDVFHIRTDAGDYSTLSQLYSEHPFANFLRPHEGETVVDVGAHIGGFTVKAARAVGPTGRVLAFEPANENFHLLVMNVEANRLANVTPFNIALGSANGAGLLHVYKKMASNSFFSRSGASLLEEESVMVRTLDSIVQDTRVGAVDCVKLNVEGFELEVLRGAVDTILRFHPRMAIDTHSFGPPVEEVARFLESFGYVCRRGPLHLLYGSPNPNRESA